MSEPVIPARVRPICSVEDYDRPARSRGWCPMHYKRWQAHGDTNPTRRHGAGWHLTKDGYVLLHRPGHPLARKNNYVLEHRVVWFEANGPIPDTHRVHHKNHDRADNRLENLELMEVGEHMRLHNAERPGAMVCKRCGESDFARTKGGNRFCRSCHRAWHRAKAAAK